ncbi:MAG: NYN domain-containing protein [Nanoarchaeota archaeon]|nr:NYN domain-containing protein [Nanoarchaeota archaeon]
MKDYFEKGVLFIDGEYLKKVLMKKLDGFKLDYLKFSDKICLDLELMRLRTYFYDCLPIIRKNNPLDIKLDAKRQLFISQLKRLPRFEVRLGKLQLIGGKFRQKMVDVLMSLDVVEMCFGGKVGHVILVAGDSDFVPAIRKAKDCGIIVHLVCDRNSAHNELMDIVDEIHELNLDFVSGCEIDGS